MIKKMHNERNELVAQIESKNEEESSIRQNLEMKKERRTSQHNRASARKIAAFLLADDLVVGLVGGHTHRTHFRKITKTSFNWHCRLTGLKHVTRDTNTQHPQVCYPQGFRLQTSVQILQTEMRAIHRLCLPLPLSQGSFWSPQMSGLALHLHKMLFNAQSTILATVAGNILHESAQK